MLEVRWGYKRHLVVGYIKLLQRFFEGGCPLNGQLKRLATIHVVVPDNCHP